MSQSDTTVKKLQVVLTGDTAQLQRAMDQAQKATDQATGQIQSGLSKVDSAFKKIAKTAAAYISVRALVNFGKQCVELGSDLTEVQNVVDTTFGKMSSKIDEFSKSAIKQFGLSETAAKRYSSTMGSMLKSMGMSTDQAYDMSTTLAGLAGDIASFYNLSADEAFAKIRSGISGQTEPLKQLGINLSVANMEAYAMSQGITKSYSAMTQAEQTLLRYNYLLTATADAQGDFSRTSDSWANQVKILRMNFESLKATLGQGLIMALLPAIKVINQLMERLKELAEEFKYFMAVLTGADYDAMAAATSTALTDDLSTASEMAVSTSDSVDSISDSLKNASAEARKFLFSFDEIHALQGDDSNGDTSDAESAANSLALGLDNVDPISELVTADALNGLDEANNKLNDLNNGFNGLSDEKKKQIEEAANKVKEVIEAVKRPVEKTVDAVVDTVEAGAGVAQSTFGVGKTVAGIWTGDKELQAEGGLQTAKGFKNTWDNVISGALSIVDIFTGEDMANEFRDMTSQLSSTQWGYEILHAIEPYLADTLTGDMKYITVEIEKMLEESGGEFTPLIAAKIAYNKSVDKGYDPTGKYDYDSIQYAYWNAKQVGDRDAELALGTMYEYMTYYQNKDKAETSEDYNDNPVVAAPVIEEFNGAIQDLSDSVADLKAYAEVNSGPNAYHGNVDMPDAFNDNPVVVAPTIEEYKDACKEGIREALDERQPTSITMELNGREVGYGVAEAMAVENVQFNPEVAVV